MNIRKACSAAAGIRFSHVAALSPVGIPRRRSKNAGPPRSIFSQLFSSTTPDAKATNADSIKHYYVIGEGTRSYVELRTDTGHTLATDVPKSMGGDNRAPQPVELLLTALVGCTQATAVYVGRNMRPERVLVDRLVFDIKAYRDEQGALQLPIERTPSVSAKVQAVTGTIKVYTKKPLLPEQLEMLREQTELRCPVASLLVAGGCRLDIRWEAASE
jgi:putative redox protein